MCSISYSKIFRPWDSAGSKDDVKSDIRESKLRKIRGKYLKKNMDQDNTISTTTADESPVSSLSDCCERLLQDEPGNCQKTKITNEKPRISASHCTVEAVPASYYPAAFTPEFGVQTESLFYESLAQNYAIEMEYARILHEESQAKMLNKKQRPKKYKCPHCHVGFSNNGQLKGHIRIHTGERPYRCEEKNCGKTFTRNEELTRHKRIHSGVRPYPCSTCGKKFGRRDHLKKHTKTHLVQADRLMPVFLPLPLGYPYVYGY